MSMCQSVVVPRVAGFPECWGSQSVVVHVNILFRRYPISELPLLCAPDAGWVAMGRSS